MAGRLAALLRKAATTGAPLIAFEPAFGMMLRQEYAAAGLTVPPVRMAQEFLSAEAMARTLPQARRAMPATLLSHCTEATAQPDSPAQWTDVFATIGVTIKTPTRGCSTISGGTSRCHASCSICHGRRIWPAGAR